MTRLQCSFCDRQQDEVKRLIAGPGIYICDQCVRLCSEILDEEFGADEWGTPSGTPEALTESGEEHATEILANEALPDALERLSDHERRMLELRFGLSGEQPRTLDEVGRSFGLTREQTRQIENCALAKLKSWT